MPAIAPRPGPIKKTRLTARLTRMPSRLDVVQLSEAARIQMPSRVPLTNSRHHAAERGDRFARNDGRKMLRLRADGDAHRALQHDGHAERAQHRGQPPIGAQGTIGETLDGDAEQADDHEARDDGDGGIEHRHQPAVADQPAEHEGIDVRAEHEELAMGEVDQPHHAIDHGVAERDEPIDGADGEREDQLLEKIVEHGDRLWSNSGEGAATRGPRPALRKTKRESRRCPRRPH